MVHDDIHMTPIGVGQRSKGKEESRDEARDDFDFDDDDEWPVYAEPTPLTPLPSLYPHAIPPSSPGYFELTNMASKSTQRYRSSWKPSLHTALRVTPVSEVPLSYLLLFLPLTALFLLNFNGFMSYLGA